MKKNLLLLFVATILWLPSFAQPSGWTYRLPITITENSGTNLYDHQVRVVLNTQALISAGQMDASGNDIRFGETCSGSTFYSHWVESGMNTASTVIWVKVDTLLASATTTIYMYHGNASATSTSDLATFSGPHSATDSVSGASTGGVPNSQRGFRFSPTEDILMTHFGKNEPNGSTRYITLFDYTTQAVLDQIQVSGPAAGYSYGTVNNPTWLNSGTQYLLILFQGASDGYYYGAAPQAGQHITYYDMRYCNSCTQNTFPTNSLGGMHYGYVDMLYYTKKNATVDPTVTPGSGSLSAMGTNTSVCQGDSVALNVTVSGGTMPYAYLWSPAASLNSSTAASPIASPSASTTYSVTVTDNGGCSISATVDVTAMSLPAVNLGSDQAACAGDVVLLDAGTGGASYSWSNAATTQTISVTSSGTYSVEVTDANSCSNSDTVSVMFNPVPVVNLGGDVIQCGGSVMLDAGNAGSAFIWQDATTAQTLNAAASGVYHVEVIDPNTSCSGYDTVNVTINPVPSVNLGADVSLCSGDSVMLDAGNPGASYAWSNAATLQVITVTASGNYSVLVTDANNCTNSDTISVMFNANPVVSLGPDTTECGPVLLDAGNPGAVFMWQDATTAQTLNAAASGTYYVTVTDPVTGCAGSDTVDVTINPMPSVALAITNDTACINWSAYTLSGGTPSGGTYTGQGVNAGMFDPAAAGAGSHTITYTFIDNNGCQGSATQDIVVDACTGLEENSALAMRMYPNPASGVVMFTFTTSNVRLQMYTPDMRKVIDQEINRNETSIDLSGYAKGIYFVVIQSGAETVTNKLIIE